jgi:hypothetical protein
LQYTLNTVADKFGIALPADMVMAKDIAASTAASRANRRVKVPRFAAGTDYVPEEMLAILDKGEVVQPTAYTGANSSNNADVVSELKELRALVRLLLAPTVATAGNTKATSKILDQVTNGGDGMLIGADSSIPITVVL